MEAAAPGAWSGRGASGVAGPMEGSVLSAPPPPRSTARTRPQSSKALPDEEVGRTPLCGEDESSSSDDEDVSLSVTEAAIIASSMREPVVVKDRLYFLDNAKFILIVCVVMTHLLAPLEMSAFFSRWFEAARFAFMMPTFTFISGYCSSVDLKTSHKLDATIKVAAIYCLAQTFWLVLMRYVWLDWDSNCFGKILYGNTWLFREDKTKAGVQIWKVEDFAKPYFHLWYLFCLIWWRVSLPYWWRLKYPLITAWISAAAFSAYNMYKADPFDTWMPDLDYIFSWYPLFCLGARAKQSKWKLWDHPYSHVVGALVNASIAWIPLVYGVPGPFVNGVMWAYGTTLVCSFGSGFGGQTLMFCMRLIVPLAHSVCIWGFLHMVPLANVPLVTKGGERCLSCYIFHPLGGCLLSAMGVYGSDCKGLNSPWWAEPVICMFSLLSAVFWTRGVIWQLVSPICDPPVAYLFSNE